MSAGLPKDPRRIFVRAPNWVGDVLMATPALRALRGRFPNAEITLCARPHLLPLLRGVGSVDRLIPAPDRRRGALRIFVQKLRAAEHDAALILPDSIRTAIAPFAARIPWRVGYARDPLRRFLLARSLDPPSRDGQRAPISMIERYQRLTRSMGCEDAGDRLELKIDPAARASLDALLAEFGIEPGQRMVVVTPGASFGASKLWPAEHFADACDRLHERLGLLPVLAPGPGEEDVAERIETLCKAPVVNLSGPPTTLTELAALIERAALLLSNDTGPRHLAVALGAPSIALLGPTDPRHTQHLLETQRILREEVECSPCHKKVCPIDHRCMTRLQPERVERAALELLG